MSWFISKGVHIVGMAAAVPEYREGIEEYKKFFDIEEVEKFINSTGVKSTHKSTAMQTASDLGYAAAVRLLEGLSIDRSEIGVMTFVTLSPDYKKPSTSCVLHKRLGLSDECTVMDVGHGCAGFVYGHQVMQSLLSTSDARYGLLVLGETTSKLVGPHDHNYMMFGDAGAAVLYERDGLGECTTLLKSDGSRYKAIIVPGGGFRNPKPDDNAVVCRDGAKRTHYDLFMNGIDVFAFSISDVPKAISEYFERTNTSAENYDVFALHQANKRILSLIAKKIGADLNKVPICIEEYGNTSSVSIPLALCDCYGSQSAEPVRVLASGFGVGLAWGVTTFELNPKAVFPVVLTSEHFDEGIIDIRML